MRGPAGSMRKLFRHGRWSLLCAFFTAGTVIATPPTQRDDAAAARAYAAVDPFIGTGGEGHTFPGAVMPFGMIQLSPDTQIKPRKEAYGWAAGYRHDDSSRTPTSRARLRRCAGRAVTGQGLDLAGQRRQRHRQPRCRSARLDFDGVRANARAAWTQALSAIEVDAPAPMRKSFYTALYHTLMGPSLFMDSDGRYRGPDNAVHQAKGFRNHSTFSLWDTYRALHPLLTLVQPAQRSNDFVNSLLAARRDSPYGVLPVWSFHGLETWCMIGYHAVPVIADAYMKGIRGYDADEALDAMVASARYGPYDGIAQYMELGYVPIDEEGEAASKTLEYAFDDWTIARAAEAMGRNDIAVQFGKRAANWTHAFDPATGFMRARKRDGSFREPFDPTEAT